MTRTILQLNSHRTTQTGVALIAALLIMLVLTIIGVTAISTTSLEEKMAFNSQDRQLARYLAESAILLQARQGNMPNPAQAGVSANSYNLDSTDIPHLNVGTVSFTYIEDTAKVNLPAPNPKVKELNTGSYATFRLDAAVSTNAGTTGEKVAGYYFKSVVQSTNN